MRAALFPLQRDCQWSGGTLGLASKLLGAAFCFWSNLDRTSCCHSSRSCHALFLIFGPTPAMASSSRSKELRCQMPFFPFAFNGFWCGLWKSVGGGTGHEAWTRRRGGGGLQRQRAGSLGAGAVAIAGSGWSGGRSPSRCSADDRLCGLAGWPRRGSHCEKGASTSEFVDEPHTKSYRYGIVKKAPFQRKR